MAGIFLQKSFVPVDEFLVVGHMPVRRLAPHGFHQFRVGPFPVRVPGQRLPGAVRRLGSVLPGQVIVQVGQQLIGTAVVRLPPGLFQQEGHIPLHRGPV